MIDPFVEISSLRMVYPGRRDKHVEALSDVSLTIGQAEFVSLLGPSGCGKSTLLMLVAGLLRPTHGQIRIHGREVDRAQTDIGIVFQSDVLLSWRTAVQNVMLQAEARRLDRTMYRRRALALLESVGLAGFADCYPYELSGGMRQRVSICRAFIHEPPLLLMDEPFGALDALTREQMMVELQRMWHRTQKTVVFVTHSIQEAVFLSDRVVVMSPRPGRVERILEIDLPRPRRLKVMATPEFTQYTNEITDIFKSRGVISEDD